MMDSRFFLSFCVFLFQFMLRVEGFEEGAPLHLCAGSGVPYHGVKPQTVASPYQITLYPDHYNPGDTIQVTLSGDTMDGFLLRAFRNPEDPNENVGEFLTPLPLKTRGMAFNSPENKKNCVTQTTKVEANNLVFNWKAPSSSQGDLIFKATVVKEEKKYWVDVSADLQADQQATAPDYTLNIDTPAAIGEIVGECGKTTGCLLSPESCSTNDDCQIIVTYKKIEASDSVHIQMLAEASEYVSLGLSEDTKMGTDETMTCMARKDAKLSFQHGYNPEHSADLFNEQHPLTNFTDINVRQEGKKIYCSFIRPFRTTLQKTRNPQSGVLEEIVYDVGKNMYHLQVARGNLFPDTFQMMEHDVLPLVSDKLSLLDTHVSGGSTLTLLIKAHGSLAIAAWLLCAAISSILARHYRKTMMKKCISGSLWFNLHRIAMFGMFICITIAIVLIFLHLGEWAEKATLHGVFGLVAIGFGVFNIILGILRTYVKKLRRNRVCFNWTHRTCGMLGFICAMVSIYLGINLDLIDKKVRLELTIAVSVWLGFLLICSILLDIFDCTLSQSSSPKRTVVDGTTVEESGGGSVNRVRALYVALFVIILLVSIAAFIATVYFLARA